MLTDIFCFGYKSVGPVRSGRSYMFSFHWQPGLILQAQTSGSQAFSKIDTNARPEQGTEYFPENVTLSNPISVELCT